MTTAVAPVTRMVRSLPAAAHIRALRCVGRSNQYIATRARITHHQLRRAYRGDPIGWDIDRRIRSLNVPDEAVLHEEMSSVGARRRLRALHALGWPLEDLAAALGWGLHKVGNILDEYPLPVYDFLLVCALYDQRWTWRPEDHGVDPTAAEQARLAARLTECVSPLAWDDDTIDNPKARPRTGPASRSHEFGTADPAAALRALDGDPVRMSGKTRTLAIEYATRYFDMPFDVIAERLGMSHDAVKRSFERIKERARDKGETWADEPRFTTVADVWQWSA
jgi:hypothetical protein